MIALWIILAALAAAAVILIAAGMLIPQAETRRMKGVITAHLLALRLYRHDLDQCLAEMLGLIKTIPAYFVKTLPALLAGLFIIAPSLKWLDDYFAFRPLRANETAILQVVLTPEAGRDIAGMNISLKAPEGMVVETPVLRIPELRELNWRVRALRDMNEAQFTPHINREMNFVKIDLK